MNDFTADDMGEAKKKKPSYCKIINLKLQLIVQSIYEWRKKIKG
jgi:hypothetical protein